MKSIQVIKSLNHGGAEALLYTFFQRQNLNDNKLCVLSGNKLEMLEDFNKIGVQAIIFRIFDNGFSLREYLRFINFIAANKEEFIFHSHLPLSGVLIRLCKIFLTFKSVYTEHNVTSMYHRITYFLNLITYDFDNKIIACSKVVETTIPKRYMHKIITIQNGVDIERFPFIDDIKKWENMWFTGNIHMLCVAGFREEKNLLLLLNVIRCLLNRGINIKLKLVGDGVKRADLETFVSKHGLEDSVRFEGIQTDIYPYLKWANFFCLTSKFEGLPISLLEAMSAGCIPICSNVGGISEVYTKDSFPLISLSNDFEADTDVFVDNIMLLLKLTADVLYTKSKYASNIISQSFSSEIMIQNLHKVYDDVYKN